MKIAVAIMSTMMQPSLRNVDAMKNTFIKRCYELKENGILRNDYDFFIYYSDSSCSSQKSYPILVDEKLHIYEIAVNEIESVYTTFEKTIKAMKSIVSYRDYDYFIRINISTYLNIDLVDCAVEHIDKNAIYCNALNTYTDAMSEYVNDVYPRGDFYMTGINVINGIISVSDKYFRCDSLLKNRPRIDHIDDCLVGACIIDYLGKGYYKHLKMLKYNFIERNSIAGRDIDMMSIASRVKTIPPNVGYSGYSWDDNEYRKYDCKKMSELYDYISSSIDSGSVKYVGIVESDILCPKKQSRPSLLIQSSNQNVYDVLFRVIKEKR